MTLPSTVIPTLILTIIEAPTLATAAKVGALEALAKVDPRRLATCVEASVCPLLGDDDAGLRGAAVQVMERLEGHELAPLVPHLLPMLRDEGGEPDASVKKRALRLLGNLNAEQREPYMERLTLKAKYNLSLIHI